MVRGSFPLGRLMGVDVRLHWTFPLMFVAALAYSVYSTGQAVRGLGVFAALVLAVLVREIARASAAAYAGLDLRILFLLPIGAVMGFAPDTTGRAAAPRLLLWVAPVANALAGLAILALSYGVAPGVDLLRQPWISAGHVLRTFVWMQFILAAVNLLPAVTLPSRHTLRAGGVSPEMAAPGTAPTRTAAAFSLISGLAVAMALAGILTANLWFVLLGGFLLLYAQLRSHTAPSAAASANGEGITVEDVMSADYVLLSSSDTFRGALSRVAATTQEVFPVVRGDRLVGAISRQTLESRLQDSGDSYVQGAMTRTLETARCEEPLAAALGRASAAGYTELIPVVDGFEGRAGGRMLGMLTPQTVNRAVHLRKKTHAVDQARQPRT